MYISMSFNENISLEQQLKNLQYRWTEATKKYVKHYPDYKLDLDKSQYNRALAQVRTTYNDMAILKANLDGNIKSNAINLEEKDKKIKEIKSQFENEYSLLNSKLGENKSAIPFKIQKYDENSKSYIFSSFYSISIFTLAFFIYKQINME